MVPASTIRVGFFRVTAPLARFTCTGAAQAIQVGMSRSWPKLVRHESPCRPAATRPIPHSPRGGQRPRSGDARRRPRSAASRPCARPQFSTRKRKATGSMLSACTASSKKLSSAHQSSRDQPTAASPARSAGGRGSGRRLFSRHPCRRRIAHLHPYDPAAIQLLAVRGGPCRVRAGAPR